MQVSQIFRRKQPQEVDAGSKQTLVPVGAFNLLKTGATNVLFPTIEIIEQISATSPAPVYGLYDTLLGHGIVGGSLASAESQGKLAGGLAVRVLKGERPEDIPLVGLDTVQLKFDARELKRLGCQAKVVFLTMHKDATYAAKALEMGASGFVLKHSASTELLAAIRAALLGKVYVTSEIAAGLQKTTSTRPVSMSAPSLTPRQRQVLQLFAEGHSARKVAAMLHISPRTAENHKARIMSQLNLDTTADLVQYALRHGIIAAEQVPSAIVKTRTNCSQQPLDQLDQSPPCQHPEKIRPQDQNTLRD